MLGNVKPEHSIDPGLAASAGVVNFLFSRDPRYVNDGCCGPRSRSAAKAAVGIKTRRLPPDLALIGGPDAAAGTDPAAAMVVNIFILSSSNFHLHVGIEVYVHPITPCKAALPHHRSCFPVIIKSSSTLSEACQTPDQNVFRIQVEPEEGGGLSFYSTLVEIQTVMSIPSFLIIIVQVRWASTLVAALQA